MSTALFDAIEAGDLDKVRALVATEPRLAAARNDQGASAVLVACYRGRRDIVAALRSRHRDLDVFEAAALGDVDRLEALLAFDPGLADVIAPDGFFPLALAAFFDHPLALKRLLDAGADPDTTARNETRVRALHSAVASGSRTSVRHLLAAGADPDARQQGGATPLMAAAAQGDGDTVRALLEAGADPGARDESGRDAAGLAAEAGHAELAQDLARVSAAHHGG